MLRTVKFLSTFSCVSLRDMKETGAASRPVPPNHSDIRRAQVLQPPDSSSDILRGSSLVSEQSPASSHSPPYRDFGIIHQPPRVCQGFFQKNLAVFTEFLLFLFLSSILWPGGLPAHKGQGRVPPCGAGYFAHGGSSSQSPLDSVSAWRRKLRPLPCSSSSRRTRFAGLRREQREIWQNATGGRPPVS